jgi:hypothetical protein
LERDTVQQDFTHLHLHIRLKKLLLIHRLIQYSYEFLQLVKDSGETMQQKIECSTTNQMHLLVLLDRLKDLRRNRLCRRIPIKGLPTIKEQNAQNYHLRKLLHQRLQHFRTCLHQSPEPRFASEAQIPAYK